MSLSTIFFLTIILPQALAYTDTTIQNGLKITANMISASYDTFSYVTDLHKNWEWSWDFPNPTKEDLQIKAQYLALTDEELGTPKEWKLVTKYKPGGVFSKELGTWTMSRNWPLKTYLAMMFKNAETKTNVLVFRGTNTMNLASTLKNLDFFSDPADDFFGDTKATVHGGFKDIFMYHKAWIDQIVEKIEAGENIIISGHSQGGGLAYLAAAYITRAFPKHKDNLTVMTYATAEAGNREFSLAYDKNVGCHNTFHFRVDGDPVSSVNPFAEIPCSALAGKYNHKNFSIFDVEADVKDKGIDLCSILPHCKTLVTNLMETWLSTSPVLDREFEFYHTELEADELPELEADELPDIQCFDTEFDRDEALNNVTLCLEDNRTWWTSSWEYKDFNSCDKLEKLEHCDWNEVKTCCPKSCEECEA